jgi:hypothetical protein
MNSIFARHARDVSILPNFIAGCRAPLVRTALSKVKRLRGRFAAARQQTQTVITRVQSGDSLSKSEIADLTAKLQGDEPVLVSLAAWTLSNANAPHEETVRQLEKVEPASYGVSAAFVKLALVRLKESDPAKLSARLKEFAASENPYLRVEAAKELVATDSDVSKTLLEKATADPHNPARSEARRVLKILDPAKPVAPRDPVIDDPYTVVLTILRGPDLLEDHSLAGETAQGSAIPPFNYAVGRLRLRWQLPTAASSEPVEIRWIAVRVGGVEKDHLIATAKSDPGKANGEFTLKKPTAGFPPGQYRVEIWRA